VDMNRLPKETVDQRAALRELPPLIKGYLRLGAYIGDGAVIDHQFGTTAVLIIIPVSALNSRYVNYYGADASRSASCRLRVLTPEPNRPARGAPLKRWVKFDVRAAALRIPPRSPARRRIPVFCVQRPWNIPVSGSTRAPSRSCRIR